MNRRDVIKGGAAITLLGNAIAPAFGATDAGSRFHAFVFDQRFPLCRQAASRATASGIKTAGIDGDVAALWSDDLRARWQQAPSALAGLTTIGSLLCLSQMGRSERLRVALRVRHTLNEDGRMQHVLSGLPSLVRQVGATLRRSDANWASIVAAAMLGSAPAASADGHGRLTIFTAHEGTAPHEQLASWIIAPLPAINSMGDRA